MLSYHNDPKVKAKYLGRVRAHRKADRLIQGTGWSRGDDKVFRGCAVGCTLERYDHSRYPVELGIPLELAHLEDRIFEGLPERDAMAWPARFLHAIPVGVDLCGVWSKFAVWLLAVELRKHDKSGVCKRVAALYRRRLKGDEPDRKEWVEARQAAAAARHKAWKRISDKLIALLRAA